MDRAYLTSSRSLITLKSLWWGGSEMEKSKFGLGLSLKSYGPPYQHYEVGLCFEHREKNVAVRGNKNKLCPCQEQSARTHDWNVTLIKECVQCLCKGVDCGCQFSRLDPPNIYIKMYFCHFLSWIYFNGPGVWLARWEMLSLKGEMGLVEKQAKLET